MNSSESESDSSSEDDLNRSIEVARSPSQDDLVPLLECPVCFDLPLPPIRTCYQGHIICAECANRLSHCPLCQKPIGIGRNFFAEDFLNKSILKCKYNEDGCTIQLPGSEIRGHLPQCHFRPLKCHYCNAKVPFSNFDEHALNQHGITKWDLNDQGVRVLMCEKLRTRNPYAIELRSFSASFLLKSLLIALIVSLAADQLYEYFEPEYSYSYLWFI